MPLLALFLCLGLPVFITGYLITFPRLYFCILLGKIFKKADDIDEYIFSVFGFLIQLLVIVLIFNG